jgi:hypothetical protein
VRLAAAALALGLAVPAGAIAMSRSKPSPPVVVEIGSPTYGTDGSASAQKDATTVPTWASSFDFAGTTFPYTMVGTSPESGGTSTVPVVVVPLRLSFADGTVFDASARTASVAASPLFEPASFTSGVTQYGDAIQRAEFWTVGGSGAYHVLLSGPSVLPTQSIDVPQNQGTVVENSRGVVVGRVSDSWLSARVHNLLVSLQLDPTTLPVFLTDQVVLYEHDPSQCCTIAFHGASSSSGGNGSQKVLTWIFAAYLASGSFSAPGIADVSSLSHEISEWMNDPFLTNPTPPWTAPGYGCQTLLETGDPLVPVTFAVGAYHLQDEAFLSWFARQVPSPAQGGRYTYLGTFNSPSPGC